MKKFYHERYCLYCGKRYKFRVYYRYVARTFVINRYDFYCCEECRTNDRNKLEQTRRQLRKEIEWNEKLHIKK